MPDLTPEEREAIYLEEKARRERPKMAGRNDAGKPDDVCPDVASGDAADMEAEALMAALQREEGEARARVQALIDFECQEKAAGERHRELLQREYEEKKAQELQRLEKWLRGNQRQLEYLDSVKLFV
jgi:hypothetical protein